MVSPKNLPTTEKNADLLGGKSWEAMRTKCYHQSLYPEYCSCGSMWYESDPGFSKTMPKKFKVLQSPSNSGDFPIASVKKSLLCLSK